MTIQPQVRCHINIDKSFIARLGTYIIRQRPLFEQTCKKVNEELRSTDSCLYYDLEAFLEQQLLLYDWIEELLARIYVPEEIGAGAEDSENGSAVPKDRNIESKEPRKATTQPAINITENQQPSPAGFNGSQEGKGQSYPTPPDPNAQTQANQFVNPKTKEVTMEFYATIDLELKVAKWFIERLIEVLQEEQKKVADELKEQTGPTDYFYSYAQDLVDAFAWLAQLCDQLYELIEEEPQQKKEEAS